jgi:hypothetical protein
LTININNLQSGNIITLDSEKYFTTIVYNINDGNFWHIEYQSYNTYIAIEKIDPHIDEHFINNSWTMSYSVKKGKWTSFHSYLPKLYLYDHDHFYTQIHNDNKLWKHNDGLFQTFYDEYYPFIIDYVALNSPVTTSVYDDIEFITTASKNNIDQRFVTFNKLIAYNSRQSTGELMLKAIDDDPKDSFLNELITEESGSIIVRKKNKNWRLNDLRDYVNNYDEELFTSNWEDIKDKYFIDKVVNTNVIDANKAWYELEPLKDKYLRVRLIFDDINLNDIKLISNFTVEKETMITD